MTIMLSFAAIDNVLGLFGRTNTESIVKARLDIINEYCQVGRTCDESSTVFP